MSRIGYIVSFAPLLALAAGCGAGAYESYDAAYSSAPEESLSRALAGESVEDQMAYGGDFEFEEIAEAEADPGEEPMVVYSGYLRLRVKRLLDAVDEVGRITEEQGGYIESLTRQVIVVRIPAGDFDEVMDLFLGIGDLLERRVEALDVTEQFTDLGARLAVAREARARLLELLETVEDVEERLEILAEIKRLSERIESIESTLATLQNLVDYFTITIELEPVVADEAATVHRSPFEWTRGLSPHRTTITEGLGNFSMDPPAQFVLFEKDDVYRAQSADTSIIRAGAVDNEPLGDEAFWIAAVHHEMMGRAERAVDSGEAGRVTWETYVNADVQPRYYLVGVVADDDDLYVVEVFYPTEEAYEAHRESVLEALATFEVER